MATKTTSATPIIRADAVEAVLLGCRFVFFFHPLNGGQGFVLLRRQPRLFLVQPCHVLVQFPAVMLRLCLGVQFRKVQLATHCTLGDCADLLTYPGLDGEFIDHFSLDQGGIHIEGHQPAIAAVHIVLLEGEIDFQSRGNLKQLPPKTVHVRQFTTHRKLHAGLAQRR